MEIKYEVFKKKIEKAEKKLLEKHILEIDGSGDEDIEGIFALLKLLINDKLIVNFKVVDWMWGLSKKASN